MGMIDSGGCQEHILATSYIDVALDMPIIYIYIPKMFLVLLSSYPSFLSFFIMAYCGFKCLLSWRKLPCLYYSCLCSFYFMLLLVRELPYVSILPTAWHDRVPLCISTCRLLLFRESDGSDWDKSYEAKAIWSTYRDCFPCTSELNLYFVITTFHVLLSTRMKIYTSNYYSPITIILMNDSPVVKETVVIFTWSYRSWT